MKCLTLAVSLLGIAALGACGKGTEGPGAAESTTRGDSGLVGLNPPSEADAPATGTTDPVATPAVAPTTCYRYAFVSGFADNVFVTDTCSQEAPRKLTDNDEPRTHFGNLVFREDGASLVFDRSTLSLDGLLLESFSLSLAGAASGLRANTAALFNGFPDDYVPHGLAFEPGGARTAFLRQESYGVDLGQDFQVVKVDRLSLFDPNQASLADQTLYEARDSEEKIEEAVWRPGHDELIVAKRVRERPSQLFLIDVANRQISGLRADGAFGGYRPLAFEGSEPAVSPDGDSLAFVRRSNGQRQIFACTLVSVAGRYYRGHVACEQVRQLTFEGENRHPVWTPDGRFLFFTSNRAGNLDLYRMNPDGGEATPIRNSFADEARPAIHPVPFTI
ncbi:MAG: hypothetical protein U1F66_01020 [bacterium]